MRSEDANAMISSKSGEIVAFGGLIGPEGANISHTVGIGGGSYTDGHKLRTGLFEFMINNEEEPGEEEFKVAHGVYSLKGLTGHEYGHVWFTKTSIMKELMEKIGMEMEAEGIDARLSRKVVQYFFNSTEDGRIESRMVNMYPGLINYFRYNNGTIWKRDSEEFVADDKKELDQFLRCVVTYCVIGLRPRWYKNAKTTRIHDEFEKLPETLEAAVNAPTCKKNADLTYDAIHIVWDYLIELLKQKQEDLDEMEEFMDGLGESDIQEGNEGSGDGTSAGEGNSSARMNGGDTSEEGGGVSECGDNSGAAGSTEGRKTEIPEYKKSTAMSEDSPGYDYSGVSGTGGGSTKVIKSKAGHKSITPEQAIEEAISEAEGLAEKEAAKESTPNASFTKESKKSSTLTREEVNRMCTDVGYDQESIRVYREERSNYRMRPLDDSLRPAATQFRRKVERCFKEKNQIITKMSSGKLDTRQLYRLGMKEFNVFQKQANRSLADAVVEICWDGSGSMHGGKQELSSQACAIVEEGLKGVVPLKIINFTTDWSNREVVHYLVKDFDENDRGINYSLSYARSKGFNGGNKDGYDIRVCTEELMKRQEKDKILIVMSDGLPSDYDSINPQDDVKDAVKCARRNGIIVIPIFFGSESFRNEAFKDYEYMYEKNIINAAPEELPNRLVKLFEALVLK